MKDKVIMRAWYQAEQVPPCGTAITLLFLNKLFLLPNKPGKNDIVSTDINSECLLPGLSDESGPERRRVPS